MNRRGAENGERRKVFDEADYPHQDLTRAVIGAAIEVHRELGAGLLESIYEICLCDELSARGLTFQRQVSLPVQFKGRVLECGCRIDLLIEDKVIVELKSIERLMPIHDAQILTCLRLAQKQVGLLINFNVEVLRDGIRRKVLMNPIQPLRPQRLCGDEDFDEGE